MIKRYRGTIPYPFKLCQDKLLLYFHRLHQARMMADIEGKKVHTTHLFLRPEQYEKIRTKAYRERITISEVVRRALDYYFNNTSMTDTLQQYKEKVLAMDFSPDRSSLVDFIDSVLEGIK